MAVLQHETETGLGAFAAVLGDAGVGCEVVSTRTSKPLPDPESFDGVIALGGSLAAADPALEDARRWIQGCVLRGTPYLGVCLGAQLLAVALGAPLLLEGRPEVGVHDVFLTDRAKGDPVFGVLPERLPVFSWHEDTFHLPRGATHLARSMTYEHQAFRWGMNAYGVEFHPEVRAHDVRGWAEVPCYTALAARAGVDWDEVASELERAAPALDDLANTVLERWLRAAGLRVAARRISASSRRRREKAKTLQAAGELTAPLAH